MRKILLIIVAILPFIGIAQEEEKKFGIKFSGFVKTDIIYDSRETVSIREGHFLLYPKYELLGEDGKDIYANPKLHMLSIQSRIRGVITGPDAFGAKTSGAIEGEFFGHSDGDLNGFRLRHAFVKLNWTKTELLVGQYWHPMFHTKCFPGTVSFNTGAPFQPFSRNPQIRLTQKLGKFNLALAALTQVDFKSNGPQGKSNIYLRNSLVPIMNLRFEYHTKNEEKKTEFLIGISGNFKSLVPQTTTYKGYQTNERINSLSVAGYLKYTNSKITIKVGDFYGQDAYDLTMLGGYAVSGLSDTVYAYQQYTPFITQSVWADIHTNGKKVQVGLFGGYTKNLGTVDKSWIYYTRDIKAYFEGDDNRAVDYIYRISPRVIINAGKFRIAPEIEYTVAAYAKIGDFNYPDIDRYGKVENSEEIGNLRFLIGVYYFF